METIKVAVEFRSRIRTCHFFVKMKDKPKTVEVHEPNVVLIRNEDGKDLIICVGEVKMAEGSIAGLQVNDDSLYFQTRSVPDDLCGSFYRELIVSKKSNDKEVLPLMYKPDIQLKNDVEIFCRSCLHCITNSTISFERILPLPSSDGCDFFCHKQSETPIDLNPKVADCFYGNFYIKINPFYIPVCSDGVMLCQSCSFWLGISNRNSVTLWNSSITFANVKCDDVEKVALQDFMSLFKFLLCKDIGVTCKLILHCRVTNDQCYYLLLWVMDKNLSLLVNDTFEEGKITLKETKVAKVLYKLEKNQSELVKQWEQDVKVTEEPISKPMMMAGLRHLEEMSSIIPDCFKRTYEMFVSYV